MLFLLTLIVLLVTEAMVDEDWIPGFLFCALMEVGLEIVAITECFGGNL